METYKRVALLCVICCIIAGCSDTSSTRSRYPLRRHYSDLPYCPGESVEIETIGTSGAFVNDSPLPMEEARQMQRENPFLNLVHEVDSQGYVYP